MEALSLFEYRDHGAGTNLLFCYTVVKASRISSCWYEEAERQDKCRNILVNSSVTYINCEKLTAEEEILPSKAPERKRKKE